MCPVAPGPEGGNVVTGTFAGVGAAPLLVALHVAQVVPHAHLAAGQAVEVTDFAETYRQDADLAPPLGQLDPRGDHSTSPATAKARTKWRLKTPSRWRRPRGSRASRSSRAVTRARTG